jgi:hypothetical protein
MLQVIPGNLPHDVFDAVRGKINRSNILDHDAQEKKGAG